MGIYTGLGGERGTAIISWRNRHGGRVHDGRFRVRATDNRRFYEALRDRADGHVHLHFGGYDDRVEFDWRLLPAALEVCWEEYAAMDIGTATMNVYYEYLAS